MSTIKSQWTDCLTKWWHQWALASDESESDMEVDVESDYLRIADVFENNFFYLLVSCSTLKDIGEYLI